MRSPRCSRTPSRISIRTRLCYDFKETNVEGGAMIRTRGLNHIHLNVSNLKRSVRFYQEAFGLEYRFTAGRGLVFLSSPGASDLITLCKAPKGEPIGSGDLAHFGFEIKGTEKP